MDIVEEVNKALEEGLGVPSYLVDAANEIQRLREENQQYLDCFAAMAHAALAVLKPKEPQA